MTLLCMGLTISWCQACANNPMFADIVPEQNSTVICSFDCSFEGGFGAMAAPMVVLLVERVYGFRTNTVIPELGSRQLRHWPSYMAFLLGWPFHFASATCVTLPCTSLTRETMMMLASIMEDMLQYHEQGGVWHPTFQGEIMMCLDLIFTTRWILNKFWQLGAHRFVWGMVQWIHQHILLLNYWIFHVNVRYLCEF